MLTLAKLAGTHFVPLIKDISRACLFPECTPLPLNVWFVGDEGETSPLLGRCIPHWNGVKPYYPPLLYQPRILAPFRAPFPPRLAMLGHKIFVSLYGYRLGPAFTLPRTEQNWFGVPTLACAYPSPIAFERMDCSFHHLFEGQSHPEKEVALTDR